MYELVIGVISLAIAVGQVVAAPKEQHRRIAFGATLVGCVVIIGVVGVRYYESVKEERRTELLASRIVSWMDEPRSFEDIYDRLDGRDRAEVDRAFDRLAEEDRTKIETVRVQSPDGKTHLMRLFSKNK